MTASSASMGTSSSTTTRPATWARTASASARSRTGQTALAVVAAPGRLEHDRPAVGARRRPRPSRTASRPPARPPRRPGPGRPRRRERSACGALSTASSSASAPGRKHGAGGRQRAHDLEVDLLVVERHDAAALGERLQVGSRRRATPRRPRRPRRRRRRRRVRPARPWRGRARWPPRPPCGPAGPPRRTRRRMVSARSPPSGDSPRQWGGHNGQTTRGSTGDMANGTAHRQHDRRRHVAARHRGPAPAVPGGRARPRVRRPDLRARRAHPAGRRRGAGARDRPGHRRRAGVPAPPDDAGAAGPHGAVGDGQPASARHRAVAPGRGRGHVGHELRQAGQLHEGVPALAHAAAARRGGQERGGAGHHQRLRTPIGITRRRGAAGPGRRPRPHDARAGGHGRRRDRDLDDRHPDRRRPTSRRPSPPPPRRPAARRRASWCPCRSR